MKTAEGIDSNFCFTKRRRIVMKLSDIGNVYKPVTSHGDGLQWARLLTEEFFRQVRFQFGAKSYPFVNP